MMPLNKSAMSTDEFELDIEGAELKASKLELEAEWADFRDKQQEWEETKVGGSSKVSDTELEAENIQLRFAQTQLKAALSQLEDVMSKLDSAQSQLEEARGQRETAARHLEAATARTEIKRTRVEASKASLEAAKMRFESGTWELEDAKSKLDDAISQVEAATLSITERSGTSAVLGEENASLRVQVSQLQSVLSKLETRVGELENDKLEQENELEDRIYEAQLMSAENSDLKAAVHQLNNENRRLEVELKQSRGMAENKSKQDEIKRLEERVTIAKSGNPKVFFDIKIHGVPSGRVVIELFADTTPLIVDNFRALCTGEKGVSGTGIRLHYKGTSFKDVIPSALVVGGDITGGKIKEGESIYGGTIPVENYTRKHTGPGDLSMVACGPGKTHGCNFFISTAINGRLDGQNLVLGKVVQGMDVITAILKAFPFSVRSLSPGNVMIADCGQLPP